jgi:hypothetical protein
MSKAANLFGGQAVEPGANLSISTGRVWPLRARERFADADNGVSSAAMPRASSG